jgi:hypothetical protein
VVGVGGEGVDVVPDGVVGQLVRPGRGVELRAEGDACRRTSPVSTYRLANVSVKPAGRFGAPDTEPAPSGVVAADELMSIPFPETLRAFAAEGRTDNPPRDP